MGHRHTQSLSATLTEAHSGQSGHAGVSGHAYVWVYECGVNRYRGLGGAPAPELDLRSQLFTHQPERSTTRLDWVHARSRSMSLSPRGLLDVSLSPATNRCSISGRKKQHCRVSRPHSKRLHSLANCLHVADSISGRIPGSLLRTQHPSVEFSESPTASCTPHFQ